MRIGSNIKKRRYELNMSQQELADALGYKTRSTIAKIESGENSISIKKLIDFARVLDTTLDALVIGRNPTNVPTASSEENNAVLILAGGKSTRNQQNIPNQFINVLGKPVIIYTMEAYEKHPQISSIFVVCLKGWEDIIDSYSKQYGITKLKAIIQSGETGILSIKNGVDYIQSQGGCEYVIFQEATRPLISEEQISKILWDSKENTFSITCEKMDDHINFQIHDGKSKYLDRSQIIDVQSPEAYKFSFIKEIIESANKSNHAFDESCVAMLLYNLGYQLNFTEGIRNNLKLIRQEDISIFTSLVKLR